MKGWFGRNYPTIIISAFLIPIITVAIVSISHVTKWYGISNPVSWAVYLSIGIEIAALSALAAISADMGRKVYFPFGIVTLVQFIGNIFFAYSYIDVSSESFVSWVELVSPLMELLGVEPSDLVAHKRYLALFAGGMLPVISLSFLHMLVKFTQENKETSSNGQINEDIVEKDDKPEEDKISQDIVDASDIVAEVSRFRPTNEDLKELEELLIQFKPVKERHHPTKEEQGEILSQMVKDSEEMGLYGEPTPTPSMTPSQTPEPTPSMTPSQTPEPTPSNTPKMETLELVFDVVRIDSPIELPTPEVVMEPTPELPLEEELAIWDTTLMDGLDDESEYWTEDEIKDFNKQFPESEWDEDHSLDLVMNDMLDDLTEDEIDEIVNGEEFEIKEEEPIKTTPTTIPNKYEQLQEYLNFSRGNQTPEPTPTIEESTDDFIEAEIEEETPTNEETQSEDEKKNFVTEINLTTTDTPTPISPLPLFEEETLYWETSGDDNNEEDIEVTSDDPQNTSRRRVRRNVGNTSRRRFR